MAFEIVRNDITNMQVDAIVNTANPRPVIGAGTDSAVHAKAGPQLLAARKEIGDIARGCSAITPAFGLDAKYVIHTVGPRWQGGTMDEENTLRRAYESALALALEYECRSVAFPLMAAGSYGFPKERALQIANAAIGEFLLQHEMDIYLVVFSKDAFRLSGQLRKDVQSYIDDNYVSATAEREYRLFGSGRRFDRRKEQDDVRYDMAGAAPAAMPAILQKTEKNEKQNAFTVYDNLDDLLHHREETFSEAVLRIMKDNSWTSPQVYHGAGMDKKLFHKIIGDKDYHPSKSNALLLAVALHLDLDATQELLAKAGFTLTKSSKFDVIVMYFIVNGNYNIFDINEVLFDHDLPCLSKCY